MRKKLKTVSNRGNPSGKELKRGYGVASGGFGWSRRLVRVWAQAEII